MGAQPDLERCDGEHASCSLPAPRYRSSRRGLELSSARLRLEAIVLWTLSDLGGALRPPCL